MLKTVYSSLWSIFYKQNAQLHSVNRFWMTALHLATENGHFFTVKKLVEWGRPIDAMDGAGDTAKHIACRKNFPNIDSFSKKCRGL